MAKPKNRTYTFIIERPNTPRFTYTVDVENINIAWAAAGAKTGLLSAGGTDAEGVSIRLSKVAENDVL